MTDAQTEARAIVEEAIDKSDEDPGNALVAHLVADVATALAAKDAELAAERAALRLAADRADRAEAQLAKARKALEPFAALADIFDHHGGNRPREGVIAQWSDHRVGDRDITVEHLRAARRAREQGGK